MATLSDCYNDSKNYSDKIMDEVTGVLEEKGISFTTKSGGHEVIIPTNGSQSESSIIRLLNDNLTIPKDIISLLLEVVEVADNVYIRQKTM